MQMKESMSQRRLQGSDFIYILYQWKNFLIINCSVVLLLTAVVVFSLPKKYKAVASMVVAPDNAAGGLGGLASLLGGGASMFAFNTKVLGGGIFQEDMILGIMNSRSVLENVISKFRLIPYYKVRGNKMDIAVKKFKKDIAFDPNEFGLIEVSVINKNPRTAADIANYLIHLADSVNIELNIRRATNHRAYIENRYTKNLLDLKKAEDDMSQFQHRYGVFSVPEQVKAAIGVAGKLESELVENEVALYAVEGQFGTHVSSYKNIEMRVNALKDKLDQLNRNTKATRKSLLIPFQNMPGLQKEYIRKFREVEIQSKLLEFIYPLYEQAKMEEHKSIPAIMIVDQAVPPQLKHSPKRMAIIIGVLFLAFFVHVLVVLRGQLMLFKERLLNPVECREKRFFEGIVRLYRLDISGA
jgi:capsule polysaccharide export protein KpsE/RkpR